MSTLDSGVTLTKTPWGPLRAKRTAATVCWAVVCAVGWKSCAKWPCERSEVFTSVHERLTVFGGRLHSDLGERVALCVRAGNKSGKREWRRELGIETQRLQRFRG